MKINEGQNTMSEVRENSARSKLLDTIWRQYEYVRAYANRFATVSHSVDSEDLVQESMTAAWRRSHEFHGDSAAVRGWLRQIVKRKFIDQIRREASLKRGARYRSDSHSETNSSWSIVPDQRRTPSSIVAFSESRECLRRCIDQLSHRHAEAIRLRYFESKSLAELGQHFGLTDRAVHMLVKRALVQLRKRIESVQHY